MKIYGLQKMTLLDFPGHVACTVFTGGCDMRCPFCHNYELATGLVEPEMEEEEFFAFLHKRRGLLEGVAITGGEPCLQKELAAFMRRIREAGFAVKLDTNGNHPEELQAILDEGLADYVAMDVKNSPEKYARTVGLDSFSLDNIQKSIALLMHSGIAYEFRTTVVDDYHEAQDFHAIGEMIRGAAHYYLQPFTDRDTVPERGLYAPSRIHLAEYLAIVQAYVPAAEIRGLD